MTVDVPDYNKTPLFEHTASIDDMTVSRLCSLGPLFETYKLENEVGLALLHRHFDIAQGQAVVWSITGQGLVAEVVDLDLSTHVPVSWRIDGSGGLSPLEYLNADSVSVALSDRIASLTRGEGLFALGKATRFIGLNDKFALSVLPGVINQFASSRLGFELGERVGHESSDFVTLTSELTFPPATPEHSVPSLWVYRPRTGFVVLAGCSGGGCNSPPPRSPP